MPEKPVDFSKLTKSLGIARGPMLCLVGLFCLLTAGCLDLPAEGESPTPTSPAPTVQPASPVTLSPQASDLQLRFKQTVTIGDRFSLEVANEGQATYVHHGQSNGNCLGILVADGNRMRIAPDLTCDALEEKVLDPGRRIYIGDWDLKECADDVCLGRELVAPGRYHVTVTLYPFSPEDGSMDVENAITLEGSFEVLSAE